VAVLTVPYREEPSTSSPGDLAALYRSEALAMYGIKECRCYELGDVLGLFGELFDVQAEIGFDPVTQERMNVFILRKGADSRIKEMNSQREVHASK
jgi:hypothetical protein